MTATMKYTLTDIKNLSLGITHFVIPQDTLTIINYLCSNVGSDGLKSNIYQKPIKTNDDNVFSSGSKTVKKRKGNKGMEVSAEEWESIRTFQATKIEQKTGIDAEIDQIRLLLNKLTDKSYLDIREKILDKLNIICQEELSEDIIGKLGKAIYDISSSNKFYSKIYADLYAELVTKYNWLRSVFEEKYGKIMEQYRDIQYVDPEVDYDGFCNMNKINENRKAVTTFLVNLAINKFIPANGVLDILVQLLQMVKEMITQTERKNEVDELTENIAILFNKELIVSSEDENKYDIDGNTITDMISIFAKCKAKDYPSLSNKAIFKYMDLVDM
jgi:hypothetical protein